jgi:DNA-binding CsgD family transcriptional regulator
VGRSYSCCMLVGRPGLSPVMVGRSAELDRLARLPDIDDAPAVALLGGEAGIGKTRLVRELCARLPNDARVLAGQADPGALGRPFELLLDALKSEAGVSPDLLDVVIDPGRAADERVAASMSIIAEIARDRQTVVIFDDLHWADAQSVELFDRLSEPGSGPTLVVGTYRPEALNRRHPVADLLPRLERRRAVTHLHLDRLTSSEVGAFLAAVYGRPPSFRVVETLHARTGGNPFFLEELLGAAGELDPDQLVAQPLPWNLGEIVRAQLEDLEQGERRILEAAAVLGRRVTFDVLASVTGTGEDDLIQILRSLVASGMLVEAENDVFSFRHALAREAIEADLLGRERRRLHEAALLALQAANSDDVASIAHHAHGAGRYDDLVSAARRGAQQYIESGSTYQALELAELGLSEACDDAGLLASATRAAWLAGLVPDAVMYAEKLLEVARASGDIETEALALRRLVRLHWERGDDDEMERQTDELIALVERLPERHERGNVLASIAQSFMLRDRTVEAIEWADRAIAYGEEHHMPEIRVWGEAEKGSVFVGLPELAAVGEEMLRKVVVEAEALGEYVVAARALNNSVRSEHFRPDTSEARDTLARMRRAAERAGFDSLSGPGYWQGLAGLAEWDGDLMKALEYLEEGRRRDRGTITTHHASWYQVQEAGLSLELGDLDRARLLVEELTPVGSPKARWWYGLAIHLACREGDQARARELLPSLLGGFSGAINSDGQLVHDVVTPMLTVGFTADEVRPLVEHANGAWRTLAQAQVLEADGQPAAALEAYEDAIADDAKLLRPSALGTAHVGAARCLIALGQLDRARVHASHSAELLSKWAGWRVDELHAVQRRLGVGPGVDGPQALTPREREVVELLAEGLTNAEVAARLYISPKTAAVHVSNILAKLGMASRSEVAAFAVREGLTARS